MILSLLTIALIACKKLPGAAQISITENFGSIKLNLS
jgi:hypothetical protein